MPGQSNSVPSDAAGRGGRAPSGPGIRSALSSIVETSVLSMAVFDREMRYLVASPAWLRDHRLDLESIEGQAHYDLFPEMPSRWKDVHRRALAGEACRCELDLFVRSDGTLHWLRWSVSPWRDEDGAIAGIVIGAEDLTESRRLRVSLDAAESAIAAIFKTVAVGLAIVDASGRYLRANSAFERMLGYTQPELRQMRLDSTIHPEDLTGELAGIDALASGRVQQRESRIRHCRNGGEQIWVDQFQAVIPLDSTASPQLVVCIRDATERQGFEDRLHANDRLASVGMLGAGLGHDMKSVLFAMRCGLDAQDRIAGSLQHDGAAHVARRQVADGIVYLERISHGLLDFISEPEPARVGSPQWTDLCDWWAQLHPLLRRAVPQGVSIEIELPTDSPRPSIGSAALSQVMLNLFVNAGQAIASHPDPSRRRGCVGVRVSRSPQADRVRLSVVDEGVGMSAEVKRRAFDPFFTTRVGVGGTGLGLAMVKRLVETAGGSIEIDSEPGRGTSMHLDLPIAIG